MLLSALRCIKFNLSALKRNINLIYCPSIVFYLNERDIKYIFILLKTNKIKDIRQNAHNFII